MNLTSISNRTIYRRYRGFIFIWRLPHVPACASRMAFTRGSPLTSLPGGFDIYRRVIKIFLFELDKEPAGTSRKGGEWGAPRESHARSAGWNVG